MPFTFLVTYFCMPLEFSFELVAIFYGFELLVSRKPFVCINFVFA